MNSTSTQHRVRQCSRCPGTTEYFCEFCTSDLCQQCSWNHVPYPKILHHDIGIYRDKFNYIPKQETCVRHPDKVYVKYCELCELPVCYHCRKHRNHKQLDVLPTYKTKQRQHNRTINIIRAEIQFYIPNLLGEVKANVNDCRTRLSLYYSKMLKKVELLKKLIDNLTPTFDFKHSCLKSKLKMNSYVSSLQRFEHSYEHASTKPIQFIKQKSYELETHNGPHLARHTKRVFVNDSLKKNAVVKLLNDIKYREKGRRCVVRFMSTHESHVISLSGVTSCCHISCVSSDRVWVSDGENIILANNTGGTLCHLRVSYDDHVDNYFDGLHTVNNDNELFYIDGDFNINKVSRDLETTTIIKKTDTSWTPVCVFVSLNTGDLLAGMYNDITSETNVTRCKQNGQSIQTIQYDNTGMSLYRYPINITENNNGDIVVSDHETAVVVTERGGRYRFSYEGHLLGSRFYPCGLCTDALSHILVCEYLTHTVQMLDKDGRFLSHLLIRPSGIFFPVSLSYDMKTHHLLVGSWISNKMCVFRYLSRQPASTSINCYPAIVDVIDSPKSIQIIEKEKEQIESKNSLHLMSTPEFQKSLTVEGVTSCYHLTRVTPDSFWISYPPKNLTLANTSGVTYQKVLVDDSLNGLHSVNDNSELIYIDVNYNINVLSLDLETTTTFIRSENALLTPSCLYWATSTGDLLVGMVNNKTWTGKVTRYNQTGQLTQTIELNKAGLEIYQKPIYITENNNGDIVVSDYEAYLCSGAVVVTDRGGMHRFSYTGHPLGSKLGPNGICTDVLSHILVCDDQTHTVQMLDKNGLFLSHLLIRPSGIFYPISLSYDDKTHCLWVGSSTSNKICAYRYISGQDITIATSDVMETTKRVQRTTEGKSLEENLSLQKLMLLPKIHKCFKVPDLLGCYHISLLTADIFWIGDKKHTYGLVDTTNATPGDGEIVLCERINILNRDLQEDVSRDFYNGPHTVNNEHELIYIDRNYNIIKLSRDMETSTILIRRTEDDWKSQCVYWSPFTKDLLVGMFNKESLIGKITRYSQTGQLTQTIQTDNTGLEMFRKPNYITDNNNGDVVVSDSQSAVVVIERGGRYRFSYTGYPSGSRIKPCGICTDALSHILVCDFEGQKIHIIDKDGKFLSFFSTKSQNMAWPCSLSYDFNTRCILVGSQNNKVSVYKYITQQDTLSVFGEHNDTH